MHSPFLLNQDLWPWRWSDLFIRFKNPERYSIILSNWSGWEVAGGDEERNSTDHRWRDGRVSSIGSARYHICVGSERDDSVYASCRGEQWIAELHIDSRAVRGGLVLSLSPTLTWALSLSLCTSVGFSLMHVGLLFWLLHKLFVSLATDFWIVPDERH